MPRTTVPLGLVGMAAHALVPRSALDNLGSRVAGWTAPRSRRPSLSRANKSTRTNLDGVDLRAGVSFKLHLRNPQSLELCDLSTVCLCCTVDIYFLGVGVDPWGVDLGERGTRAGKPRHQLHVGGARELLAGVGLLVSSGVALPVEPYCAD